MLLDRLLDQVSDIELKAALETAELMLCDNVADYLEENTKEDWNLERDYPNIAPPFPVLFLEWMEGWLRRLSRNAKRLGLLVCSAEVGEESVVWTGERRKRARDIVDRITNVGDVKWVSMGILFIEKYSGRVIPWGEVFWGIQESGRPVFPDEGVPLVPLMDDDVYYTLGDEEINLALRFLGKMMHVPFLALSFMHCKNVVLRETTYSAKLQKARVKRGHRPFITYRVIEVHPIRKILESEGAVHKIGLKKALHICRGHFKDFSVGKGLFGKIHGIYWWDAHIRGDKKLGMSLKDYDVFAM